MEEQIDPWQSLKDKFFGVVRKTVPWYVDLAVELLFLFPDVAKAVIKSQMDNKDAVKKVSKDIRGVVGEPPELKNI